MAICPNCKQRDLDKNKIVGLDLVDCSNCHALFEIQELNDQTAGRTIKGINPDKAAELGMIPKPSYVDFTSQDNSLVIRLLAPLDKVYWPVIGCWLVVLLLVYTCWVGFSNLGGDLAFYSLINGGMPYFWLAVLVEASLLVFFLLLSLPYMNLRRKNLEILVDPDEIFIDAGPFPGRNVRLSHMYLESVGVQYEIRKIFGIFPVFSYHLMAKYEGQDRILIQDIKWPLAAIFISQQLQLLLLMSESTGHEE